MLRIRNELLTLVAPLLLMAAAILDVPAFILLPVTVLWLVVLAATTPTTMARWRRRLGRLARSGARGCRSQSTRPPVSPRA